MCTARNFCPFYMLQASLEGCFSARELSLRKQWIIDPFLFNADQMADADVLNKISLT